jgi:hypothetical protein
VVIPTQAIDEVTPAAVWLRVSAAEAARHHDFDPACFRSPEATWQAPYPYQAGDLWLRAHGRQLSQPEAAQTRTAHQTHKTR